MGGVATLFCFSFAVGIIGSLLFVNRNEIAANFFRLNAMIAAVLLVIGEYLKRPPDWTECTLIAVVMIYAGCVRWLPHLIDRAMLILAVLLGSFEISRLLNTYDRQTIWHFGDWMGTLAGGLLMGLGLVAMNIGHSYLSAQKQSMAPLRRATKAIGAVIVLRGAYLVVSIPVLIVLFPEASSDLSRFFRMEEISLIAIGLVRILFGLIGPFFLTLMTWETVKLESTQSATGILYALFALVLVGEASALFITLHTAISG